MQFCASDQNCLIHSDNKRHYDLYSSCQLSMDGETGCRQTWLYYECHYVGVVSSNFFNHVMRTADIAQSADRSESESAASIEQARISMQIS